MDCFSGPPLDAEEIVGESAALKRVLSQAKKVAPSDATVLILGETGTGKELIARSVHRMSLRRNASFIKLNCAAIPVGLLESELFGHEKGAFTGAVAKVIGRLESAHHGTLFLDEVGELPLELQPKLLRVLQEGEFQRLGSNETIRVDVRLLAATNQNLAQRVAQRKFRPDLYYRLNVFPVRMPALRERVEDISVLACYLAQKYAHRMNKKIETITDESLKALAAWEWPGNIRELENLIERSVILSDGTVLEIPLAELRDLASPTEAGTLDRLWRECVQLALRETGGLVDGPGGAALRLGMNSETLHSIMQKMGLREKT
jgi:formate hydrogenlyase transcriptional activator